MANLPLATDLSSPGVSLERRTISTASTTFSSSLLVGQPYYLMAYGSTVPAGNCVHFTLNGATPSLADGAVADLGIPIADLLPYVFVPQAAGAVIKALNVTGSAQLVLFMATSGARR